MQNKGNSKIWLSPTGIGILERCPRCFWLKYRKKISQPEGIVSRLANRFDVLIKKYFDLYRSGGELPPMIEGKVKGKLENPFQEKYFINYSDQYGYLGKLDECLITDDGEYTPVDHKTSSSNPSDENDSPTKKQTEAAYQFQLDSYAWLLEENNKKSSGIGHLIYFYPEYSKDLHDHFKMKIFIKTLKTDPERAKEKFIRATKVLDGLLPEPSSDCPFCAWYEMVGAELGKLF